MARQVMEVRRRVSIGEENTDAETNDLPWYISCHAIAATLAVLLSSITTILTGGGDMGAVARFALSMAAWGVIVMIPWSFVFCVLQENSEKELTKKIKHYETEQRYRQSDIDAAEDDETRMKAEKALLECKLTAREYREKLGKVRAFRRKIRLPNLPRLRS